MTRIKVFKTPILFSRFMIIFGGVSMVFGVLVIYKAIGTGFNKSFPSGDWNAIIFIFQGLLFNLMGILHLINKKYYIEWDDKELRFLLPDTKKVETITFEEIVSVNIKLFEIQLSLQGRTRSLDLNSLQFEYLKKIKEKFESLSNQTW